MFAFFPPLLAIALAVAPARAESEPLRLSLVREAPSAPEDAEPTASCPDARAVAAQVRARLGRDPFDDAAPTSAEVAITRRDALFVGRIVIRDERGNVRGERTITSDAGCASLGTALAIALALYVDPESVSAPGAPAAQAKPPSPPVPDTPAAPARTEATGPHRAADDGRVQGTSHEAGAVTLGAIATSGLVSGVGGGATLAAEIRVTRRVSLIASGFFVPEQRTTDRRFAFGMTAAGAGACVSALRVDAFEGSVCAALMPGAVHAVVYTLTPAEPGARAWLGLTGLVRARFGLAPSTFLEAAGGVALSVVRYDFVVGGTDPQRVYAQNALAPMATVSLGRTFP